MVNKRCQIWRLLRAILNQKNLLNSSLKRLLLKTTLNSTINWQTFWARFSKLSSITLKRIMFWPNQNIILCLWSGWKWTKITGHSIYRNWNVARPSAEACELILAFISLPCWWKESWKPLVSQQLFDTLWELW